ncbi:hypothetical protein Taro_014482 [Colocasia esculenta]|uniref:DUF1985 domain-containing protein n=1 Tax=Colocasia esculenta TaxID=4460 RepID=A0A843UEN6_COLES|nr:hypothetical protein [Colocasia esculenta]
MSAQTGDSFISHLCRGDPSLPTCVDERLLVMATKRKIKSLSGKRTKKAFEDATSKHLSAMGFAEAMFENIPRIPCEDTSTLGLTPSAPPTAQPITHMHKQKVVTRKRHKQTPKALPSLTNHVASGAEGKRKRYVNNPLISRCSLHIYMKDKEQIKFCECHKELLRATPFAPYVDIPPMKFFGISLLEEIVAHHEVGNVCNIGKKSLSFTVEDVALILGMPCIGFPMHHYGSSIEVSKLHKRFGKDTAFTRQVIHGYLIDLVGSAEKEDIEDTVWLWILLLLSTFLAPRSAYICSPQMIKYLDDIERIRSYAWAVAFHELILHNIEEASKMVKMNAKRGRHDEKPRKNHFIFACFYALCVWLEHTHSIPPINCLIFPWLFRWDAGLKKKGKIIVDHLQMKVMFFSWQRGNTSSGEFASAEETSTPALSINAQMAALVDALNAVEESRKAENEDFQQNLESIVTQVEGFAKSVNNLTQEKEKADDPPSDPPCEAVEKENFEEEMQVSFVEDRRDFHGSELLVEENLQLITKFLSMEIN